MKLVLIGGGDYGTRPELPYNLKEIDETIVKLSEKSHPRFLFIGFSIRANHTFGMMKKQYFKFGAQCEYLSREEFSNEKTVEGKFKRADIIYIGGGNTMYYMSVLKRFGLDKKIIEAASQGKVIAGRSAGAIIISSFGSSDSRHYKNKQIFTSAKGLGIFDIFLAPHFSDSGRKDDMQRIMKDKRSKIAIGLDNQVALVVNNDNFEVVKSNQQAKAFKMFYSGQEFACGELENAGKVIDLTAKQ